MTYSAVYCALIESRKQSPLPEDQYSEQHHIVPKSEGGSDDKSNLVRLSAREHYIAHLLLVKIYDDYKMYSALIYMQTGRHKSRKFKFNSRLYEKMRKEFGIKHSQRMKGRPSRRKGIKTDEHWFTNDTENIYSKTCPEGFRLGRTISDEWRQKIGESHKGVTAWNKGKTGIYSKETIAKISKSVSDAQRGIPLSEAHKSAVSNALKNYYNQLTPEQRAQLSGAAKARMTQTVRDKISKVKSQPVQQLDLKTDEVLAEFPSATEAFRRTGIHNIPAVCRGERLQAGSFRWCYIDKNKTSES